MTKEEMLEQISTYPDNHVFVGVWWSEEDIIAQAEQNGIVLDREQVESVAYYLESNHDASYGISWDTITWAIQEEVKA